MKNLLVICILVLCAAAWPEPIPAQSSNNRARTSPAYPIPYIKKVTPAQAPSGAVVLIDINAKLPESVSLSDYRLAIGGQTADFFPLYKNDTKQIVARVPDNLVTPVKPEPGASIPVEILFYDPQEQGGVVYKGFNLIIPTGTELKAVEVASVRSMTGPDYEIVFDRAIPMELWGQVEIFIDDRRVNRIVQMEERVFRIELPADLPASSFRSVLVRVGNFQSTPRTFNFSEAISTPLPTPTPASAGNVASGKSPFSSGWEGGALVLTVLAILLTVAVWILLFLGRRSKQTDEPVASPPVTSRLHVPKGLEELHLPKDLPSDLVDACAAGECVLYAGAGLSAQSGLPTWKEFVLGLLRWAHQNGYVDEAEEASFHVEIERGQADPVADSIVSKLVTEEAQAALYGYLRQVFLKQSSPSEFHYQLKRIKFSAALTTNFDNLLEDVYETQRHQVYTPKDADALLAALTRRNFFLLKLYGTLDQAGTVMVAPAQYEDAVTGNSLFAQFMQTLFFSRTLLFIGASLEGIEAYLRGISLPKVITRRHYAVVGVTDHAWRAKADLLERRYGIKVLPYTPQDGYAELGDFLNKLTEEVAARQDATAGRRQQVSRLKRLTLENIGPFDNLTLDFNLGFERKWHILLGDNGVGKSTVLKAIAFALCGEKAQPYAGRLLKYKGRGGKITLETDNKTSYVTTINRNESSDEAEIISTTARPLEAEGWLALGFPPLRTTNWEPPKGPEADIRTRSRPVVDDLLPLITGDVDPRLDRLKQWIVNLDYLDIKSKSPDGHYRGPIQKVFDIIGEVAEGMKLNYRGVGDGNRILIETDDGTNIPLEALSQGTISLMGWIGILMQRLYEVFDQDADPTQRYALVLMDEIDAHMHPLWQRKLVNHLKNIFPEAQFIATTHSPLVVAGMPAGQVVRFARDENGTATILPVAPDMTLGYTDQILTSMLFNLPTTLDDTTEKKMERYYQLDEMEDRGGYQEEHERLRQEIIARVPPRTASYEEKHEEMLAKAQLLKQAGEKLRELSPEGSQTILARAEHLLSSLGEDKDDDPR